MTFPSVQPANTMVHVQTQSGEDVLTFVPTTAFQTLVLASPSLKSGTTYVVYSGGSSTGTAVDGLYSGEKYSEGTQAASFTV